MKTVSKHIYEKLIYSILLLNFSVLVAQNIQSLDYKKGVQLVIKKPNNLSEKIFKEAIKNNNKQGLLIQLLQLKKSFDSLTAVGMAFSKNTKSEIAKRIKNFEKHPEKLSLKMIDGDITYYNKKYQKYKNLADQAYHYSTLTSFGQTYVKKKYAEYKDYLKEQNYYATQINKKNKEYNLQLKKVNLIAKQEDKDIEKYRLARNSILKEYDNSLVQMNNKSKIIIINLYELYKKQFEIYQTHKKSNNNLESQTQKNSAKSEVLHPDTVPKSKLASWVNNYGFLNLKTLAEHGDPIAQRRLARYYTFVDIDLIKKVYWLQKSAKQGDYTSQNNLAYAYFKGSGVTKDIEKAVYWYLEAIKHEPYGITYATNGLIDIKGREWVNKTKTVWYLKEAPNGNSTIQYYLGLWYEKGYGGLSRNLSKAIKWYTKSANKGFQPAINKRRDIKDNLGY